jgi:predicted transcriptional regulator
VGRRKNRTLTEVELEFMHVMWDEGKELTPEDFRARFEERGRPLAGASIRKMLQILIEKGYVERRKQGHGHVYWPIVSRRRARSRLLQDLLRRAFGGDRALMVNSLMEVGPDAEADAEDIEELAERYEESQDAEDQ